MASGSSARVTIRDVATVAGVSVTTVSHALNDYHDVGQATSQRVRRVASELGYVPSTTARGLRLQRTWLIGVILPDVRTSYFHELLQCIEDKADSLGYGILLLTSRGDIDREQRAIEVLQHKQVDGIIFASGRSDPLRQRAMLRGVTVPLVLATPSPDPIDLPAVIPDPYQGVTEALAHLRALGHHYLLYLAGPDGAMSWYSQRRDDAIRDNATSGQGWLRVDVIRNCSAAEHGDDAARQYLQGGGVATAVLAFSDHVAAGVLQALYAMGRRVPDTMSVIGFDDLLASVCAPPLSSVAPPKEEIGDAAITLLLEQLEGQPKRSLVLPTRLLVRASTGPG